MIDDATRSKVYAAVEKAWDSGCPVAGHAEATTETVLKLLQSASNRKVKRKTPLDSGQEMRRYLANGLVRAFEEDPKLVGPLIADYFYLADEILEALLQ